MLGFNFWKYFDELMRKRICCCILKDYILIKDSSSHQTSNFLLISFSSKIKVLNFDEGFDEI
jgi:hypothetical protein